MIATEHDSDPVAVFESLANRYNFMKGKKGFENLKLEDMIYGHPKIAGGKSFYGPVRRGSMQAVRGVPSINTRNEWGSTTKRLIRCWAEATCSKARPIKEAATTRT